MNVPRDPNAILGAWLEDGPNRLPEATRRAIAVNTRTTTQRRRPIWMPQRRPFMSPIVRFAIAAVAIVVVVGGVLYVFAPAQGGVGGRPTATASPTPRPTSTPSASPTPAPSPAALADVGVVFPGTYVPRFDPPLTFTIDREVEHNCAPGYDCRGNVNANLPAWLDFEFGLPRIEVFVFRVDKVNDPAQPGRVMDPPADLADWIAGQPGLTVIAQKVVTVGGLEGTQLDVQTEDKDVAFGPITGVTEPSMALGPNGAYRLILVPVAGRQVLISLVAEDGSLEELQPLVDSIVWN